MQYDVEHSLDGVSFSSLASLPPERSTHGTIDYHYTHPSPPAGANYYRIKATDIDETVFYTNTVMLTRSSQPHSETKLLSPNPTRSHLNISLSAGVAQQITIRIVDMKGVTPFEQDYKLSVGSNTLNLPLGPLAPGIYALKTEVDGKKIAAAFVKE